MEALLSSSAPAPAAHTGSTLVVPYDGCKVCDPSHWSHRYLFLFMICFLCFGNYFVYDNPAALQDQFLKDMDISNSQFMLMYSLYSWPNVVLCFFGGYVIDKWIGIRLGAILFSAIILVGQAMVALGAQVGSYDLILAGRFVFGLGGENLAVAQNTYAVSWFKGKELNMVFGLQLSFSRVGSTVNMVSMVPIYNWLGGGKGGHTVLGGALWVGALFCLLSLVSAFAAAWMDKRASRMLGRTAAKAGDEIRFSDIKHFPATFWLICLVCVAYYVAIFPFVGIAQSFFQFKYGLTQQQASTVNSLVYLISAGASPVLGFLVDRVGRNLIWVIVAVLCSWGAHTLMAYTFLSAYAAMAILGVAYSMLASSLWPMVALVVPEHQLGTAYGFMQAVQNLGLAVVSLVAGVIVDEKGYLWLEVFFCSCMSVALMISVLLLLVDAGTGGVLNWSAQRRREQAQADKLKAEAKDAIKSVE